MMPSQTKYPEFVPDQILTNENLNDLFLYLDEQGRMTRTSLLGMGIACGLEVKPAANGSSLVITKGTGITSEGYLVSTDPMTYTQRVDFNPEKEAHYGKFLNAAKQKKFDLWELKQSGAVEGGVPLNLSFLNGNGVPGQQKVVLLFVELLEEQNKNCNPDSCDDKGITVRVNLRALLVRKQDVDTHGLKSGMTLPYFNHDYATLAELRMRRFDTPATHVVTAAGLLTAYRQVLTGSFLSSVEHALSLAWSRFRPVLGAEFMPSNPFSQLAEQFAYVHNGSISLPQLRGLQYVYDHFSDLIAAYEELRRTGMELLDGCCPDASLFPRHLLLDLSVPAGDALHSAYRHRFRPSPLFEKRDLLGRLRSLFRRLALMVKHFKIPEISGSELNPDPTLRITPSRLDPFPLSEKAIPYYYEATQPPGQPLFQFWNHIRTQATDPRDNLSWHAGDYGNKDFVKRPLLYDLEPYNFLRIEGHLGKSFSHALAQLKKQVKEFRLPIDVIGLCLSDDASDTEITDPQLLHDIQTQYEVLKAEILCCLRRQAEYWGKLKPRDDFKYGGLKYTANLFVLPQLNLTLNMAARSTGVANTSARVSSGVSEAMAKAQNAKAITPGISLKADALHAAVGEPAEQFMLAEYFKYQAAGDFNLSRIPIPEAVFDLNVVAQFALQIIDSIGELLVLLAAENPLTLDTDVLTAKGAALEKVLQDLVARVEKEMAAKRPFLKIKTYVGEARHAQVDAIASAMPDLSEDEADTVVLLLLNLNDTEKAGFIRQLKMRQGDRSSQVAAITEFYGRLDRDGMMVPAAKDVIVTEDSYLKDMRNQLRQFNCLCALTGFVKLRERLRQRIEELKQANLFRVFAAKHPGMQHKAGVTMGGTFILAYMRKGKVNSKIPETLDPVYAKVANDFPDGMVVADFYLPYLSYSNHPSVVYQVQEAEPAPEQVTLTLQPNARVNALRYSVDDQTPYAFTHAPNLGTLINGVAANGVLTQGTDHYVFTPAKAKALLGNDAKVGLEFSYEKRGVKSETLKVTIFNTPTTEITWNNAKAAAGGALPTFAPSTVLAVKATVKHADSFVWLLQDATGKSQEIGKARELTGFSLSQEGEYTLSMKVGQSETGSAAVSNVLRFMVKDESEKPIKVCGNLYLLVESYYKLPGVDPQRYQAFEKAILKIWGISEFFDSLKKVMDEEDAKLLAFFKLPLSAGDGEMPFATALETWLRNLHAIIVNDKAPERLLALSVYRLLSELLLYVSCLRKEDLGKAEEQVFSTLRLHVQGQGQGRGKGLTDLRLGDAEKIVLTAMKVAFEEEVKRNALNNKVNAKPKYARVLKAIVGVF